MNAIVVDGNTTDGRQILSEDSFIPKSALAR